MELEDELDELEEIGGGEKTGGLSHRKHEGIITLDAGYLILISPIRTPWSICCVTQMTRHTSSWITGPKRHHKCRLPCALSDHENGHR